ncbi:MAG: tetratricopeptide repeat protein [Gemmatimonadota bacterium]
MTDAPHEAFRAEYDRLRSALDRRLTPEARDEVRAGIIALFRKVDASLQELTEFKESIRALVDGFKSLPSDGPAVTVRYDHIGASTSLARGWSDLAGARWVGAETHFREAIARDPSSADAQALLGWALMHQHRADEAMHFCMQVLLRDAEHGLARVALGVICVRKGILGEAMEHLSRVAGRSTDARAVLYANYWLGVVYLEREMDVDAAELLRRAVRLGPNLAEGWADLGRALWFQGDVPGAEEAWTTGAAVRHSPFAERNSSLLQATRAGGPPPRSAFR